jgi:hypothetical protein
MKCVVHPHIDEAPELLNELLEARIGTPRRTLVADSIETFAYPSAQERPCRRDRAD